MSFSLNGFRDLVEAFRTADYAFAGFSRQVPERTIILRHDIDFSVELAARLAREEAALGVSATYFFMLTSNFYNLLSSASRRLVAEIQDLGHSASLHFDPTVYDDMDEGFAAERHSFENAFGKIDVVSIHRPGRFLDDHNRSLGDCLHTYQDRFFRDMTYVSDSGGAFGHGHPLDSEAFATGKSIHLLLHPIWWTTDEASPSGKLREWKARHVAFLLDEINANCKTFDGQPLSSSAAGTRQ